MSYKLPDGRIPYVPPIHCRFCGGEHRTWDALEACRDRHSLHPKKEPSRLR